ncbi:MAG: hypothetical protein K2G83_03630 [Ruminococcus sp.]|nr:hypothetical protein [Ruminococcus sp.]
MRKRRNFGTFAVGFAVRCERIGASDPYALTCNEIIHFLRYAANQRFVQIAESLKSSFPADDLTIVSIAHSGSQIACVGF